MFEVIIIINGQEGVKVGSEGSIYGDGTGGGIRS